MGWAELTCVESVVIRGVAGLISGYPCQRLTSPVDPLDVEGRLTRDLAPVQSRVGTLFTGQGRDTLHRARILYTGERPTISAMLFPGMAEATLTTECDAGIS